MKKKHIALFCILTVLFWGGQYAYVPTLTPYAESIGSTIRMIGLIGGSYGLLQLIFRIPIGMLSDMLQKRKPGVLLGVAFVALSGICFLLIRTPAGVLAARSLSGLAASFWGVFAVMFASYFKDQVRGIGFLNAAQSLGMVIATLTGGVISQRVGETAPFWVTTILGGAGVVLALTLKEEKIETHRVTVSELYEIRKEKGVIFFSLLGLLLQFVSFGTAYVFTPLVAKNLGASDAQLGMMTFLFTLPSVAASLLIGTKGFRRIGFRWAFLVSFLLLAVTCVPIALAKTIGQLFVLQLIAGFGRGICFTGLLSLVVSSVSSEKKATATGFYQAVYALGMFIGPVFTGLFGSATSFVVPYAIMGIMSAGAGITAFLLYNRVYRHSLDAD